MTTRRSNVAISISVMAVVLAGCSDATPAPTVSEHSIGPTTLISPSPVPSESDLSPQASEPTESLEYWMAIPWTEGDEVDYSWPPNADGTVGSGCTPPSGDVLPDGVWFVEVTSWGTDSLTFDLMCQYYESSEYVQAQLDACDDNEDGYAGCGDSMVWITNDSPRLRTLPVSDDATYMNPYEWTEMPLGDAIMGDVFYVNQMWLFVNGGEITQVLEQYYS